MRHPMPVVRGGFLTVVTQVKRDIELTLYNALEAT